MKSDPISMRPVEASDRGDWIAMRTLLWPDESGEHALAVDEFLAGDSPWIDAAWVAVESGQGVGFLEARIRPFAAGCAGERVPYVEGWFVREAWRGRGVGARLVQACALWARDQGFSELASDTEIENLGSQAAHQALGFEEVERAVAYRMPLDDRSAP